MNRSMILPLIVLAGCKSAPEPAPEPEPEPEVRASVTWSVPLKWEQGIPMIDATVRDGQTDFVISTSSTYHTLSKSFASRVRAPVSTGRQTTVVHGGASEVERVEGVVSIRSAGADWRLENVVATANAALDAAGVGGFVVPQRLVTNTTTIVLDLRGGALTLVEGEPELFRAWFAKKYGEASIVPLRRDGDGLLFTEATVAGAPTKVMLDSSIATSRFDAASVGAEVADGACVEGADLITSCLPGAKTTVADLAIGEHAFGTIDAIAVPSLPADTQAAIGADVLKRCVLAISPGNELLTVCD